MKSPRFCKRGHPWNETNTRMVVSRHGRKYRQCRLCIAAINRLRYRTDPDYREREKARTRQNWRAKRGQSPDPGASP